MRGISTLILIVVALSQLPMSAPAISTVDPLYICGRVDSFDFEVESWLMNPAKFGFPSLHGFEVYRMRVLEKTPDMDVDGSWWLCLDRFEDRFEIIRSLHRPWPQA